MWHHLRRLFRVRQMLLRRWKWLVSTENLQEFCSNTSGEGGSLKPVCCWENRPWWEGCGQRRTQTCRPWCRYRSHRKSERWTYWKVTLAFKANYNWCVQAQLWEVSWTCEWVFANSPDHPLKQVMDDEVGLSDHDQQSHVGPPKLWERKSTANHSFKGAKHLNQRVWANVETMGGHFWF